MHHRSYDWRGLHPGKGEGVCLQRGLGLPPGFCIQGGLPPGDICIWGGLPPGGSASRRSLHPGGGQTPLPRYMA